MTENRRLRWRSAQTPSSRLDIMRRQFEGEFYMVSDMRPNSPARQKSGYFGVITIGLIVAAALCWGLAHI